MLSNYTSFLFARPSFLEGAARLFDIGGSLNEYNSSPTPREADRIALAADWMSVGDALTSAMTEASPEFWGRYETFYVQQPRLRLRSVRRYRLQGSDDAQKALTSAK